MERQLHPARSTQAPVPEAVYAVRRSDAQCTQAPTGPAVGREHRLDPQPPPRHDFLFCARECSSRAPPIAFSPPSRRRVDCSEWQVEGGGVLEANPEIGSAAVRLGEVAGRWGLLGLAGGPRSEEVPQPSRGLREVEAQPRMGPFTCPPTPLQPGWRKADPREEAQRDLSSF